MWLFGALQCLGVFIAKYYTKEVFIVKKLLDVKRTPYTKGTASSAMNCANCSNGMCNGGGGGTSCGGGGSNRGK